MPIGTAGTGPAPRPGPGRVTDQEARQRLEHERGSRLAQLDAFDETSAADDPLMTSQREAARRVLKEIDAAFGRVSAGTYGTCVECGRQIPVERLEILPYARCCVGCQHRSV